MCACRDALTSLKPHAMGDLHPNELGRRDFVGADQVEETLLSFSDVFVLVFQLYALSLACTMYINDFILYPVSYWNRIAIILERDDIICLTSERELNFDLLPSSSVPKL